MAQKLGRRRARRRLAALAFLSDIPLEGTERKPSRESIIKRELKQRLNESRASSQKISNIEKGTKNKSNVGHWRKENPKTGE